MDSVEIKTHTPETSVDEQLTLPPSEPPNAVGQGKWVLHGIHWVSAKIPLSPSKQGIAPSLSWQYDCQATRLGTQWWSMDEQWRRWAKKNASSCKGSRVIKELIHVHSELWAFFSLIFCINYSVNVFFYAILNCMIKCPAYTVLNWDAKISVVAELPGLSKCCLYPH